jgi:hypothetical protein
VSYFCLIENLTTNGFKALGFFPRWKHLNRANAVSTKLRQKLKGRSPRRFVAGCDAATDRLAVRKKVIEVVRYYRPPMFLVAWQERK